MSDFKKQIDNLDTHYRDSVNEHLRFATNSDASFDKSVFLLSAGILSISISYLLGMFREPTNDYLLWVSCVFFIGVLILTLIIYLATRLQHAVASVFYTECLKPGGSEQLDILRNTANYRERAVLKLRIVALSFCIIGIVLLSIFTFINRDRIIQDRPTQTVQEESHSPNQPNPKSGTAARTSDQAKSGTEQK
jgi:hypothetical protein